MTTYNSDRLGISLPTPGSAEPFTVTAFNDMIESLDAAVSVTVCTSSTRPGSPFEGQAIFETDTSLSYVYDGSDWTAYGSAGGGGGLESTFLLMGA